MVVVVKLPILLATVHLLLSCFALPIQGLSVVVPIGRTVTCTRVGPASSIFRWNFNDDETSRRYHQHQHHFMVATHHDNQDEQGQGVTSMKQRRQRAVKPSSLLQSLPVKVGGFYGVVVGLLVSTGVGKQWLTPKEAIAGCGLLWMGFVLAISFMEAWVKFRAPFLPPHYGLDVGRTVFPVLNGVEVALCSSIWLLVITTTTQAASSAATASSWRRLLACATTILLSQALYLTPQLVLLGKHVIADAFPTADATWSTDQKLIYEDLRKEVKTKSRPSSKLHIVYVLQELVKVVLIGKLLWSCRSTVPVI